GKKQDSTGVEIFKSNSLNTSGEFTNSLVSAGDWWGGAGKDVELDGVGGKISVRDTIKPSVKIEGKTITLSLNPNWKMDASFLYELSFNVYANKNAYNTEGNKGYENIGEDETGATSENKKGLYSNTSGAFSFTFKNQNYNLLYNKPVIQIIRTDLTLTKIGNGKTPLSGAKFDL
ncbi:hypothetical protein, partial [uncultured Dubosiella sp.]|uniref:DUF7604 domain-containing protein n=1 Tax=uncultured Dubosiella sp. TaxID=1937011 RepID=UPI0025B5C7FA